MWRLVPALIRQMGAAYPELPVAGADHHGNATARGDPLQAAMLERGLGLLAEETAKLGESAGAARRRGVPPIRHVRLPARPHGGRAARAGPHAWTRAGFDAAMAEQRTRARAAWAGSGDTAGAERVWFELRESLPAPPSSRATATERAEAQVTALVIGGMAVTSAPNPAIRSAVAAEPNPVLRRERRPGGRCRDHYQRGRAAQDRW